VSTGCPEALPSAPARAAISSRRSVVIVDDEEDIRLLLRMALERSELLEVVAEAADGNEAIRAANTHHPDVVLLDLTMPGLDGLSALPALRAASPHSLIVVLTAMPAETRAEAAFRSGADGYLEKVDLAGNLVPVVEQFLQDRGPAQSS
jgi:CheY-like chemotaxis protein